MEEINGCLFVGRIGLFKMYCEFEVMCINSVREIQQGDIVSVSSVKSTEEGHIVFEINSQYYFHHHFVLLFID